MSEAALNQIRDLIQQDIGNRGLRTDATDNLISACSADFHAACHSLAKTTNPSVAVVTGFYIPHARPPCGELSLGLKLLSCRICLMKRSGGMPASRASRHASVT